MRTFLVIALALVVAAPGLAVPGTDDHKTVWGAILGINAKGILSIGVVICTSNQGLPTDCDQPLAQRGQATFDLRGWNADRGNNTGRELTVWVGQSSGVGTGFSILPCSDIDDNHGCFDNDAFSSAYSSSIDVGGDGCDKDEKDCGISTTVGTTLCVPVDIDTSFDDITVFIYDHVDAETTENDDVGLGVSEGTYEVYLDYGAYVSSC